MTSNTKVYITKTDKGIKPAVETILTQIDETRPILKSSKEVYLKVNGVHCKKNCFTNPEVLRATIECLYREGAEKVFVMEDSTIGNVTRLVFELTGYTKICKETGAKPIYLDEEKPETVTLCSGVSISVPKTITRIAENRGSIAYINLPKLKSHNATVVTLGIKNQYGFLSHDDRKKHHDTTIHSLLADLYHYIQPNITMIDGINAVSGEMPITAFEDMQIRKLDILIGGTDTLAVDVVGSKILGYTIEEVPHLKLAHDQRLGEGNLDNIVCLGESLQNYVGKSEWNLIDQFPRDVKIIRGSEKLCREGCEVNTLIAIQMLVYDYGGKGGFFVLMGQGFNDGLINQLKNESYTRGLIAGSCAIKEVGTEFIKEFGKRNIYFSSDCCNVAETVSSLVKLTRLSTFDLIPTSTLNALSLIISAKLHGSRALLANLI